MQISERDRVRADEMIAAAKPCIQCVHHRHEQSMMRAHWCARERRIEVSLTDGNAKPKYRECNQERYSDGWFRRWWHGVCGREGKFFVAYNPEAGKPNS